MEELLRPAKTFGKKHLLPLTHHAITMVVEQNRFHRKVVVRDGFHLANVHPQAAVAVDVDDQSVGTRELSPDGGRQPEAHCAHGA